MQKFNKSKKLALALGITFIVQLGVLAPLPAQANPTYKHYVSDSIQVPLRRGAGNEFRIIRMLQAGSPISVLKTEGNWTQIEYMHNNTPEIGWIDKIAVQNQPPASLLLEEQNKRYARLETRFKTMEEEFKELKKQATSSAQQEKKLNQENFELNKELEHIKSISSQALELDQQAQNLKTEIRELEAKNLVMRQQLSQAEDTVQRQWFLTGAGVLLAGLLLGRFFRIPKRKGGWDKI